MKKKKKTAWKQYLITAVFLLIGMFCGILFVDYLRSTGADDAGPGGSLIALGLLILGMYAVMFLQIILHEAGHLIFGLMSGYRFSSFRVGSLMLLKENGRLRLRKFSLTGTGGQCLMAPPPLENGRMPVFLYNMGGPLMNLLTGLVCLALWPLAKGNRLCSLLLLMAAVIGFAFAAINGIPLRLGTVDNDGYNALSLGKNPDAVRALWIQLTMQEQISRGVRLREMPEEWFAMPSEEGMKNSMTAAIGVFACNRLMDAHRFAEANEQMKRLLEMDSAVVGLHRSLLICDRIFCELIGGNKTDAAAELLDRQQKKFMKSMKNFLTVVRTEYVCALLLEDDPEKAAALKNRFEKNAGSYPYPSEVQGERELLELAEKIKKL